MDGLTDRLLRLYRHRALPRHCEERSDAAIHEAWTAAHQLKLPRTGQPKQSVTLFTTNDDLDGAEQLRAYWISSMVAGAGYVCKDSAGSR